MVDSSLFRWVGSKRLAYSLIARRAEQHLAATGGRVVSLFYGGGYCEQRLGKYDAPQIVAEAVPELRALYAVLASKDGVRSLTAGIEMLLEARAPKLRGLGGEELKAACDAFYRHVRGLSSLPTQGLVAARFLFLVGTCYNGMWRVNLSGEMNTPPDHPRVASWSAPSDQQLQVAAMNARRLTVVSDWTEAASLTQPGDLLVADPPYAGEGMFDDYTAARFGADAQARLAEYLMDFSDHNCGVIAFNSLAARPLYEAGVHTVFNIEVTKRSGRFNSDAAGRADVEELLITGNLKGGVAV